MKRSGLNSNKERREFWERVVVEEGMEQLQVILCSIDPVSARVLSWHYLEGYSFKEITRIMNRSISIVRNHHNRGIFELQQYFIIQRAGIRTSSGHSNSGNELSSNVKDYSIEPFLLKKRRRQERELKSTDFPKNC